MNGKWRHLGSQAVYQSDWVNVSLDQVELSDGRVIDHHVVKPAASDSVVTLAHQPDKGVLMIWRHRFITDTWGWELPGGVVDSGEELHDAARRELYEETGWRAGAVEKMFSWRPVPGLMNNTWHAFMTNDVEWGDGIADINEVSDLAWLSPHQLATIIAKRELTDGFTLTALLYALQFGPLQGTEAIVQ